MKRPGWQFSRINNLPINQMKKDTCIQSAPSGQFQGLVKHFCGSSAGRWANATAEVQPGQEKIATGSSKKT